MQVTTSITLTVLHDGQFWIGIFEHADEGCHGVCRVVFGAAEPNRCRAGSVYRAAMDDACI